MQRHPLQDAGNAVPDDLSLCPVFQWNPRDLSKGGTWCNERVHSLRAAVSTLFDLAKTFQEGLDLLAIHRTNYTAMGPAPKWSQLLWWEFPPKHWTPLREGSPTNFMVERLPRLNPNTNMD
jgi:hypothetical protein